MAYLPDRDRPPPNSSRSQVWLVPLSGRRPTALTPLRGVKTRDLGDFDAWSLPSGLYLQSAGACGTLQIFRQARNGSVTLVTVPHTEGDNHVLTALGSRLLIQAPTSCDGGVSLLWFDPGPGPSSGSSGHRRPRRASWPPSPSTAGRTATCDDPSGPRLSPVNIVGGSD